jgi:SAM-dependent methyltransferase
MTGWNTWAIGKIGHQAVMMTSKPIAKYRDFIERHKLLPVFVNELAKDAKILEVGCGNGRWTRRLLKLGYTDIFSFDSSRELIKMIDREKLGRRFAVIDMYDIAADTNLFDAALLLNVIPHGNHERLHAVMIEVEHSLKQNGKIILMDEFIQQDIREISSIMSSLGFNLKSISNVNSEAAHKIFNFFVRRSKAEAAGSIKTYGKTSLKHYLKILFEFPIDIILSPLLKNTDIFSGKIIVFERQ